MASVKRFFGTDGIRNQVGQGMIAADQVLKLGWATGKVMRERGESRIIIGKDTRISGYMFESALEAGLIASGIDVLLVGPMPTPAIAYLTQTFGADAGIVISASHNPHHDNGIKFFSANGKKVSDEVELAIEAAFDLPLVTMQSEKLGKAKRIEDAAGRYIEFCKSTYHAPKKLAGLKVVLDCAHGATYHIAPYVFKELGAEVSTIGVEPDGVNINQACGATDLKALRVAVIQEGADLGIAFDGDGDRLMMVDQQGEVVDGDEILYILASYAKQKPEGVVGTLMSNLGLEVALKSQGIDFERAQVGDRYVMEGLVKNAWRYGAEQSGHILCMDKTTTGDGIVAALQVLSIMMEEDKKLAELKSGMQKFPQFLENIKVANKKGLDSDLELQQAIIDAEAAMAGKGRVLIRASGTEPLIRVMVEGESEKLIRPHLDLLVNLVQTKFC